MFLFWYNLISLHCSTEVLVLLSFFCRLADLFASLPADTQKLILLQASSKLTNLSSLSGFVQICSVVPNAEETPHTLTKCKVWLATVRLFPDTANTIGVSACTLCLMYSMSNSKISPIFNLFGTFWFIVGLV